MEKLKRLTLRRVLILPFLIQIFVIVGLTGWLSFRNGQQAVNDVASQLRTEVTARIHDRLEAFVETPQLVNKLSVAAIDQGLVDLDDADALELMFWQQINTFVPVTHSYVGLEDGYMHGARTFGDHYQVFVIDDSTGGLRRNYIADENGERTELEREYEYDPRGRPWYTGAVETAAPSWSTIYADKSTGYSAITAVYPLYNDNDELQGVLGSSFIFTQFNKFLQTLKIGKTGQTFIIERNGNLVSTSVETSVFNEVEGALERILASKSEDALIRETAVFLQAQNGGNFDAIADSQQLDFQFESDRQFVQVTPLKDEYGLDWLIIVTVPEADFMEQINANARTTAFLIVLALIIAVVFGIISAHRIAAPIDGLNHAAQQFAHGEWEQEPTNINVYELQQLETSFTSMAHQIQTAFATLEGQNEELQRLDKLKDRFLANTSHELRTPLNGIIGIAESMIDGATGSITPEQSYNLAMVVSSGRRLSGLVNDILDLSQIEHGAIELKLETVDTAALVDTVLALSAPTIEGNVISIENKLGDELPYIMADGNRVQQILHNLVGNAIKFTEQGTVSISGQVMDDSGQWLEIVVSDSGIGIPEDKLTAVFQSFEQVDASITRVYGGTGLGLSVTRELVELHGGSIWVESTLGEGAQFYFTLPISQAAVATYPASNVAVNSLHRSIEPADMVGTEAFSQAANAWDLNNEYTILVVDDEPINIQVLTNYLIVQKYNVITVSNGTEALAILEEMAIDVILLDIMMPNLSGYETCQHIRQQYTASELPVIMLTAKNQIADLVMGFAAGANDYITKPFAKDELLSRVNTHLRLSKINTAYGRFVPHEFLHYLNKATILDVKLGDQVQQTMTIMFADIRGFTAMSEQMTPKQNFDFINALLNRIGPIIREYDGFIDKYIGDAVMALFSDEADKAVNACIAILERLAAYNTEREIDGKAPIRLGIGLHTGSLMLGTIGEEERMDTTVISDSVNLSARIEKLTRSYGANLLISEQTLMSMSNADDHLIRFIGEVEVSGKSKLVRVYEIFDADETAVREGKLATRDFFEKGVNLLYAEKDLTAAAAQFRLVLEQCYRDQAAILHLQQIEKRRAEEGEE